MSVLRLAAWVCAAVHVAALATPCPDAPPQARAHMAHRAHGHAVAQDATSPASVRIDARCPCGCDEPGGTSPASSRLGWAELAAAPEAAIAPMWTPLEEAEPRLPGAPGRGIDPVPI